MQIDDHEYLDKYGLRRKRFVYDRRVHHSYVFVAGREIYTVVMGSLADKSAFARIGYIMPEGLTFPANGMTEVWFDKFDDIESVGTFRHVNFAGLGSAVVLQSVALALIAHYETVNAGGFVFQVASNHEALRGRKTSLEDTYDYLLGLKNNLRYNRKTGSLKKAPRSLLPSGMRAYKDTSSGGICYVILP